MNILIISQVFPPKRGGVQTAAYNTAKFLSKMGNSVVVLTCKWGKEQRSKHKMDGFFVYRYKQYNPPEIKGITQISSLRFMPKAIWKLPHIIKKHKIDLIHAEGRLFPISWVSAILNMLIFKRPMFVSVQGRLEVGISGVIENIFDKIITKHIYEKNLKKIICVSDSLKKRLISLGIKEEILKTIPNGVDISEFYRRKDSRFLDKYLNGRNDFKRVIFVGRLDYQKGVEYLIRAIPMVVAEYQEVHFFILGNGNLEIMLKNLVNDLHIQDYVTFLNFIPLEKMPDFYSSADIFCLPSIHEGFPLSIAESLSVGLIIVASKTEGIPEAISENKNGFLVNPRDYKHLSSKLVKALTLDDSEINKISNKNIRLSRKRYSWEKIIKNIYQTYFESA
ncbi:MAG: glycosyltransferase [Candidatus Lokiarchaeota archaeon]|nr:glycosyltransferase [Candidatus Lokiarchaeota archaeon]